MAKSTTAIAKSKKQRANIKNATKPFDSTTNVDRLRTVGSGNDSHPTCVVKPIYKRLTFPSRNSRVIKRTNI